MNATMNISIMTMSSKEAKAALEKRLKEELNAHESTEVRRKMNKGHSCLFEMPLERSRGNQ